MHVMSAVHYKQCLLPKSRGDKTQGVPSTSKSRGTCPPVHPRISAHGRLQATPSIYSAGDAILPTYLPTLLEYDSDSSQVSLDLCDNRQLMLL